jgi:hypothetical protein
MLSSSWGVAKLNWCGISSLGEALLMGCGVAQGVWRNSLGAPLLIGCGVALAVWRSLLVSAIACRKVDPGYEYRSGTPGDSSLSNSDEKKR